jgi:small-conductance mechanosensitive channel
MMMDLGSGAMALLLQAGTEIVTEPTTSEGWLADLSWETVGTMLRALTLIAIGVPALLLASRWARRHISRSYSSQQGLIVGKLIFYVGMALLLVSVLRELGYSLAPLLGAAGVVGIAVGFASQTSVSNVISGFFLIAERPFAVDDVIQVGQTTGRVLSIDTLSVKLRTFDNRFVRIPNETIVKSEVITITRFPIRRLDLPIGVGYDEDVGAVREVLLDVVTHNPKALMEPAPAIFFEGYGESSLDLKLSIWVTQENYVELKNTILEEVKALFDVEGIEIPFPHRTLHLTTGADYLSPSPSNDDEEPSPKK